MADGLAVLGVAADRAFVPQLREARVAVESAPDQPGPKSSPALTRSWSSRRTW
jgi:hypothetical protein